MFLVISKAANALAGALSGRDVAGDVNNNVDIGIGVDTDFAASTDFGEHCVCYNIARPVVDS